MLEDKNTQLNISEKLKINYKFLTTDKSQKKNLGRKNEAEDDEERVSKSEE